MRKRYRVVLHQVSRVIEFVVEGDDMESAEVVEKAKVEVRSMSEETLEANWPRDDRRFEVSLSEYLPQGAAYQTRFSRGSSEDGEEIVEVKP